MDYRKKLEKKFLCYQSILAGTVDEGSKKIDLEEITKDYVVMGVNGEMCIRYIPLEGSFVYMTLDMGTITNKEMDDADVEYPIDQIGDGQFSYLVEVMRKAMIIQELRNTFGYK